MFQNNPLLSQLKQQIRDTKPQVEGTVKGTDKSYGFLECEKKSYFLPPQAMKKVVHGDKVKATVETLADDKEQAEPIELIEPSLTRFIAKVQIKNNKIQLLVDHPQIRQPIPANKLKTVEQNLVDGDWVVAKLKTHPLRDDRFLFAQVTDFICSKDDEFAPWWVTLARHEQSRYPVDGFDKYEMIDTHERQDLTALHFVTIDSETTKDMDDALCIEPIINENNEQTGWKLAVAIADPTAYIAEDSSIEIAARQRCFTNYLPGFDIPMLPRELADELCSLTPNEDKATLVCFISTDMEGNIIEKPVFISAIVSSKAKLAYNNVSDYLEQQENAWQPETEETKQQIDWLHQFTLARINWRKTHSLLFKESPDYSFVLAENGKVEAIKAEYRRIANKVVEECMIIANICAADFLNEHINYGIFNTHIGFSTKSLSQAQQFLINKLATEENREQLSQQYTEETLTTLDGYCKMRQHIDSFADDYLELRLRRFLTFAEFKAELAPHFGLGLTGYATWTSPIRKYSDMVNHRLIKAFLNNKPHTSPSEEILQRLQEARRQNRLVERDIADWLYCRYLNDKVTENPVFIGKIQDISRGGLRVRITENGASVFVPISTIHPNKSEIEVNFDDICLLIQGEVKYKLGDEVDIKLIEVKEETRNLIGELVQ